MDSLYASDVYVTKCEFFRHKAEQMLSENNPDEF